MRTKTGLAACAVFMSVSVSVQAGGNGSTCPKLFQKGVIPLEFQPAFIHVDRYDPGEDGLTISSFFNPDERDLLARITDIGSVDFATFDPSSDVEVLTDLTPGTALHVWPNEAMRAPDGVFPFEAVVSPQGFHPAAVPGRLTAIDVSDPDRQEYVIQQSTQAPGGFTGPLMPDNEPRFYHRVLFMDMNGDGLKDLVTVRSGFRVVPSVYPPFSELVYFVNPGSSIDPDTEWQEVVLYGGPAVPAAFLGPDIHLDAADLDGDGIPEIAATHFFSGDGPTPQTNGKIALYGVNPGQTWADIDAFRGVPARSVDISTDQGLPFDVEFVDLNLDGRLDILASNHQPDNCSPATSSEVPGRVYAYESPPRPFEDPWPLHTLLDDIRPQPSVPPVSPPGRLSPGRAQSFVPIRLFEGFAKPWVVVGGDEAGKVWVLRPRAPFRRDDWTYDSFVVFDINAYYGPETTQTPLDDPPGVTISTIGGIGVRYDRPGPFGLAELYVPVFEARDIHVLSFRAGKKGSRVRCTPDETLACEAESP